MFNQLTLAHVHPQSCLSLYLSLSLALSLFLPQSSGCRVFITFGLRGVSDSITQPACDVTQWGCTLVVITEIKHTWMQSAKFKRLLHSHSEEMDKRNNTHWATKTDERMDKQREKTTANVFART